LASPLSCLSLKLSVYPPNCQRHVGQVWEQFSEGKLGGRGLSARRSPLLPPRRSIRAGLVRETAGRRASARSNADTSGTIGARAATDLIEILRDVIESFQDAHMRAERCLAEKAVVPHWLGLQKGRPERAMPGSALLCHNDE
jgi:hypothetical protein